MFRKIVLVSWKKIIKSGKHTGCSMEKWYDALFLHTDLIYQR